MSTPTEHEYDIEGDYGNGWELVTCEETKAAALQMLKDYRDNVPGVPFRIRKVKRT